ncbi:DUF3280 domain-containing protein [Salipiger marinus]|uniref:DUF3280 domain-containing protein n=1 Tax=Salipiger marinus TaxID=555512 RepID=UPI0040596AB5
MSRQLFLGALACALLLGAPARADQLPVAVFDIEFINFSQEAEFGATNEVEQARARMLSVAFRDLLQESGRYQLVDMAAAQDDIELHGNPFRCNACEAKIARSLGAERSFTGGVQKLSVLVQTIIIRERDASTGKILAQYQTDIRGNTDVAWRRGLEWLMRNRMLPGTAALDVE